MRSHVGGETTSAQVALKKHTPKSEPEVWVRPHWSVQHGGRCVVHGLVLGPCRRPGDLIVRNREAPNILASYVQLISCFVVQHALHAKTDPDSGNSITLHLHFSSKVAEMEAGSLETGPLPYRHVLGLRHCTSHTRATPRTEWREWVPWPWAAFYQKVMSYNHCTSDHEFE